MSGRFKKAHIVSLVNEPEPDEDDFDVQTNSDRAILINEDEMTKEHAQSRNAEEEFHTLSPNVEAKRWNWRFWRKQRRYELNNESEKTGRKITIRGRTFHLCRINSWRAIFLVLFVFSVTMSISIIISKLAAEPANIIVTDTSKAQGKTQAQN